MFKKLIESTGVELERVSQRRAELSTQMVALDELSHHWPEGLPEPVQVYKQTQEWWATVEVADFAEAFAITDRMDKAHLGMLCDGWRRLCPVSSIDPKYPLKPEEELKGQAYGYMPLALDYFGYVERGPGNGGGKRSIIFWLELGNADCLEYLVRVQLVVKSQEHTLDTTYRRSNHLGGYSIKDCAAVDNSGIFNRNWLPGRGSDTHEPNAYFYKV